MSILTALIIAVAQLAPAAGAAAPDRASLEKMALQILAEVEEMRGQKLPAPMKMGVKDKPAVMAFIRERLDDEYGPAKVAAEGRMLKLMGLLPPQMDYGKFIVSLMTEQVAGFYDHTRQELHIAAWVPSMMQGPIMAHEIFHAIQDQAWGIGKLLDSKTYSHDAILAHAALAEGDATIVMFNWQQKKAGAPLDMSTTPFMVNMIATSLPMQMASPQFPVMAVAPDYLKQSLIFPYQQGLLFVAALRQAGLSWDKIREVYADPPSSTEQILHPEKYYPNRDHPSVVKLPEPLIDGFKRTWDGVCGEFHARQILLTQMSVPDAIRGADGWDGDMSVLEVNGERGYAVSAWTWDDEPEAQAWLEALKATHAKRGVPRPTLETRLRGTEVVAAWSHDAALAKQAADTALAKAQIERR